MNVFLCVGNLTAAPDVKRTQNGTVVASFSVALNKGKNKEGADMGAAFPRFKAFGKTAEIIEKYLKKGSKVAITAHVDTGSYQDKDGKTVYTTDFIIDKIEFLPSGNNAAHNDAPEARKTGVDDTEALTAGFIPLDDDIPF